jgi:hypothetical protein
MSVDLDDLVAPPSREGFREELWERAEQQERRAARRWRPVAIAALVVAAAAISGAGVLARGGQASVTIDRTIACPVPIRGGVPVFHLFAQARGKYLFQGKLTGSAAQLAVGTTAPGLSSREDFVSVTSFRGGFGIDQQRCHAASQIALERSGLPKDADYLPNQPGVGGMFGATCLSASTITVRLRTRIAASGAPVWAKLAVRSGKKLRPIVYVDWTPDKVTTYLSPDCRTQ